GSSPNIRRRSVARPRRRFYSAAEARPRRRACAFSRMLPTVTRYASVYPLVTARAVARPFTYLGDGLEKGTIVSVPFGRARRRGVVVGLEDEAPPEVEPVAVDRVLGAVPPALVD